MKRLLVEYLEDFLRRGDEIAFVHRRGLRTHRWSYKQIVIAALEFAGRLESLNIGKGDRAILCAENSAQWVAAFFGCLLRGTIVVPLDMQSDSAFANRVQTQVEAKLAILDHSTQKHLNLQLPAILLDELPRPESQSSPQLPNTYQFSENDVVEIVFTSGATAEPKGVRITNQNLMSNLLPLEREIQRYLKWERLVHPVRFLNVLPLSHIMGQFMGLFVPQMLGGQVFFQASLNASEIIATIKREKISVLICVPRILDTLRERVQREYDSRWFQQRITAAEKWNAARRWWTFRKVHKLFGLKFWAFISGGATLSDESEDFWRQLGFVVIQGYGMTETASLISVNHPFRQGKGSIGKVMAGQEVKLSANGEILVRGKNVSPGYWNIDDSAGRDSWFNTGDLGEFDDEGNLYFKGRKKDVIVTTAGLNIYPEDIEKVLHQQPEVKDSVVIPFAGPHGPEPMAVLMPTATDFDAQGVIERVNKSLTPQQRLMRWTIWPEEDFPRTPIGKIKKQVVMQKIAASSGAQARPATSNLQELFERAGGAAPDRLEPSASLATDLKLDSLGRVELLSEIEERYQVEINEAAFTAATTVADVQRIIREGLSEQAADYPYPHWPHRFPMNWIRIALLYVIVFPLTRLLGRPTVRGRADLDEVSPPVLFIANHLTYVDHALVLWALSGRFRRRVSIAMDGEILRGWLKPPAGTVWFTRLRYRVQYVLVALFFNVFSLPHHSGFRRSFAFAGEMIECGYNVLVFPEGRRSDDGKLQAFKGGTGLLVKGLNVPVVPIRIDGLYELAREGRHTAPSGAIKVTLGPPVSYSVDADAETIAQDLQSRVTAL